MAFSIGLEGPRPTPMQAAGTQLLGLVPRRAQRAVLDGIDDRWFGPRLAPNRGPVQFFGLGGIFTPIQTHPVVAIGALLFGAWLGGTSSGKALVRRFRRK